MEPTTILIIDPTETSDLKERLTKRPDYKVLGELNNLDIGFTQAERLQPTIIILNVDLLGLDVSSVAEAFVMEFPLSSLILATSSKSKRVLRYALQAGAKDVISLPIEDEQLFRLINRVVQHEMKRRQVVNVEKKEKPQFKTITVFSTKGGVGRTTVSLNLAIALRKITKKRVVLVDLDLMSGNIALMAGVSWKRTIKELIDDLSNLDEETLDNYLVQHSSGLKILGAPIQSEYANFIQADHVEKILNHLSKSFNYVVIDTPSYFHDTLIPALEKSTDIVTLTTLDLASIQNLKQCLEVLNGLSLSTKIKVAINRLAYSGGLRIHDLEEELAMEIQTVIPEAEKLGINAVNMGDPIVLSAKNSPTAKEIENLATALMSDDDSSRSKVRSWGLKLRK